MLKNFEENTNDKSNGILNIENSKSINKVVSIDDKQDIRPKASLLMLNSIERNYNDNKYIKGNIKIVKSDSVTAINPASSKSSKLTFDSVYNKNPNVVNPSQLIAGSINININNININNINITNVVRKSNTSNQSNSTSKKFLNLQFMASNSIGNFTNNNDNDLINKNLQESINASRSNQKNNQGNTNVDTLPLPKITNSNKDTNFNSSLKKKLISNKISIKQSPPSYNIRAESNPNLLLDKNSNVEKDVENKNQNIINDIASKMNVNKNSRKKVTGTVMGVDDQNDSLINELADFLNGTPNKYDEENKETNADLANNENDLNKAIINDPIEEPKKKNFLKSQQNFREITEQQILQSNNEINNDQEEEQGPPINFEHMQLVNEKRPQTSYGGISARQKSLQNSLRQKSSKIESIEGKKSDLSNPFGIKNKLSQMKHFFNN